MKKTAGYSFSTQGARRAKRRSEAQIRQASPSGVLRGLREQIANAASESAIKAHLAQGNVFDSASAKTRRQWSATAKRRMQQLTNTKQ